MCGACDWWKRKYAGLLGVLDVLPPILKHIHDILELLPTDQCADHSTQYDRFSAVGGPLKVLQKQISNLMAGNMIYQAIHGYCSGYGLVKAPKACFRVDYRLPKFPESSSRGVDAFAHVVGFKQQMLLCFIRRFKFNGKDLSTLFSSRCGP